MTHLLHHWVTRAAERAPGRIAVVLNDERLTYGELEAASNRLARMLREQGCRKGDRICFIIPKSPAALVTILGILKADCVYTPIDPGSPAPRAAKILDACQNRWILYTDPATPLLNEILKDKNRRDSIATARIERGTGPAADFVPAFSLRDVDSLASDPPDYENNPEDPAYLLFTSGSTGTPKGVVITHSNVIAFIDWARRYFDIRPEDRMSGHIPLTFDLSVFDMFGTFSAGAELHLVPSYLNMFPHKLAEFIRTSGLTQWFSVPSTLNLMAKFDVVRSGDFPALKRVLWCGEVFPTPALIYWMKRLPGKTFTNLYGPTEATIASSYYTVPECPADEKAEIPIGVPCEGESLIVLDDQMNPVQPGEIGNLYIGGAGLSPGYWNDPAKTDEVFVRNSSGAGPHGRVYRTGDLAKVGADGLVYFVGRADSQIKSRGYRIELGEIETALNAVPELSEGAIVAVSGNGFEGATICCAFVPRDGASISPIVLRKMLSEVLPDYMLPARWMQLGGLPKNSNGKIDRPLLRERFLGQLSTEKR